MKKLLSILLLPLLLALGYTLWAPDRVAEVMLEAERSRNGLRAHTVEVEGQSWPYLANAGGADKPVIVMVHGFSADKDNWVRFGGYFSSDYHVVAPDLPGFGGHERHPDWDYRLSQQVQRLHAFTRVLGLQRFHLVGNSMGGHITALYALSYPEQVISAGLFDNAGIPSPEPSEMESLLANGVNPLLTESVEDFERVLAFTMETDPFIPWPVRPYIARQALQNRAFNDHIFQQLLSDRTTGLSEVFSQIQPPVLVVWGRQDRALHVSAVKVMQQLRPGTQAVIMENTGHLPMVERPGETAAHYRRFIESVAG